MGATLHFSRQGELLDIDGPSMSYSNTLAVLRALGYNPATQKFDALGVAMEGFSDFEGSVTELLTACDSYMRSNINEILDIGTADQEVANTIVYGRRAGYITEKVYLILQLCHQAIGSGADKFYFA